MYCLPVLPARASRDALPGGFEGHLNVGFGLLAGNAREAFEKEGMERVIAGADSANVASLRVIEMLGMKPIGNVNLGAPDESYYVLRPEDLFSSESGGHGLVSEQGKKI